MVKARSKRTPTKFRGEWYRMKWCCILTSHVLCRGKFSRGKSRYFKSFVRNRPEMDNLQTSEMNSLNTVFQACKRSALGVFDPCASRVGKTSGFGARIS